jgi:hypothetical protein
MVGSSEICSADPDSNGHWLNFTTPSQSDVDLTTRGADIETLFHEYQSSSGWWNDYGNITFTIEDFLGLYLMLESSYNESIMKILSTVFAQVLYNGGWNPPYCASNICRNGVFNFIAANIDGRSALLAGPNSQSVGMIPRHHPRLGGNSGVRALIRQYGKEGFKPKLNNN